MSIETGMRSYINSVVTEAVTNGNIIDSYEVGILRLR
jgi:hypothetical protein